jgi:2-polyprenyl-3-methyl-5-hydroxy-6-metoxy-1,4-benzoquinol methylase
LLTVDYRRLGVEPGDLLLDMGAGGGRHAFEGARRGARVVPFDVSAADLKDAAATLLAMIDTGDAGQATFPGVANGDAIDLPFRVGAFDRIIASEVLEHVLDDRAAMGELARVLRPGGTVAVTVPRWLPEQLCWAISDEYHAPLVPGGHVRIYRRSQLIGRLRDAGLHVTGWHHTHGLHSPYWWLRCAVGPARPPDDHVLVRAYHRLLVWDLMARPLPTRAADAVLDPLIGKSLVVYARKVTS